MDVALGGRSVAVVGGGYAGMAAAVTLAKNGVRCTVFEAGKTLGGRARRIEYRGEILDNGQHILAGAYSALLDLIKLVGVPDSALLRVPLRLSMPPDFLLSAPRAVILPAALRLAWALLTAKGLVFADKLAAVRFMRTLENCNFQVAASLTVAMLLAEQKQPQNLIDLLWQPLTISALNTPLASASAQVFANVLRDSLASTPEASDLLLPCVDLSALFPDPAATWLVSRGSKVHAGVRVTKILPADGKYTVISDSGRQMFDGIIIAVGPHQIADLMPDIEIPVTDFEPIVTVYFKFDQPVRLREPMFGQARGLAQWFFDRQAIKNLNGGDNLQTNNEGGLVAAVISASGPHEFLSQEELADRVFAELLQHNSKLPLPVWRKVVTEKFATFACTPGAKRPVATTFFPGVIRAGDYVAGDYPATLEGAVRNGVAAAHALGGYLQYLPVGAVE